MPQDAGVCDESETAVDIPGVGSSSSALVSKSEESSRDVAVCEKSEIAPCSAELVYISDKTKTDNVDVCEDSDIVVDIPGAEK